MAMNNEDWVLLGLGFTALLLTVMCVFLAVYCAGMGCPILLEMIR